MNLQILQCIDALVLHIVESFVSPYPVSISFNRLNASNAGFDEDEQRIVRTVTRSSASSSSKISFNVKQIRKFGPDQFPALFFVFSLHFSLVIVLYYCMYPLVSFVLFTTLF